MPIGVFAVSPCTMSIMFSSIPSIDATICGNEVSWPWPCECEPVSTEIEPVAFTRTVALSYSPARAPSCPTRCEGAMPQASTQVDRPRPRSLPREALSARRAAKPASSEISSTLSRVAVGLPLS